MKKTVALLLSALLVVSLTACGEDDTDPPTSAPGSTITDSASGALDGGTGSQSGPDNSLTDGIGAPNGSSATPQSGTIHGATYGQMLRNGRVHDRDGYLMDGENAATPGTLR